MVLASDSVAAVCTEWYSCSVGGCRWLQLAAVCTEDVMVAAVCALDIWLQAAEGCSVLQCALDVMVCALGGRFIDWIMNRNSALVTTI